MVSDKARLLTLLVCSAGGLCACSNYEPRYPLRDPVWRDQDLDPVHAECRLDEKSSKQVCMPEPYESSFAWDAADNSIFRPIAKFFQADYVGEAENVNAFDEVPDSSWFTNRIGLHAMSPEEAALGYCGEGPMVPPDPPPGSWLIDHGKDNGANPGFRVNVAGVRFMFKTDDTQPERATGATSIASRMYYAAGWWAPCDAIVWFKKSSLRLKPGLIIKANVGPARKFDQKVLDAMLAKTARRGELYRAAASRWLPGKPLGPFTYEGKRSDDPSDVIAHENRRDLRGGRLFAAWLNHFDSREQNTMSTWIPVDPENPKSPGHVRHWYIDLGDCFGSEWTVDGFSKRHGHSYLLDFGYMLEDFGSLGLVARPWDRAKRTPYAKNFGYFSARDFDAEAWRGEYPNPAFGRMSERDGAWAARIISRFTPAHVAAAVRTGDFTNPVHTNFLIQVLLERQHLLLKRYFAKLSPVSDVRAEGRTLCAVDLAQRSRTFAAERFRYRAEVSRAGGDARPLAASNEPDGRVCITLDTGGLRDDLPANASERYTIIRLSNGVSQGPLLIHLYDVGARGLRVVGLERPAS
jgi:hypothetical protein